MTRLFNRYCLYVGIRLVVEGYGCRIILFAVRCTGCKSGHLVGDNFVPVFYSEKPAVPVGRFVPVFDDDAYVIDFPYFINTPPEYFSLLL